MNQQNRKNERKIYKKQIEELNKKLEDLTQAIEMLKSPNSYMTQKSIKIFVVKIYSKGPEKNYRTNKTDVFYCKNFWSLVILDLKDYVPENNRGFKYVFVKIDNFSKYG